MLQLTITLVAGACFGAGLGLSGMMNPARVRGFLDIFGHWDPTLAFVMLGAISVMTLAWHIQRKRSKPLATNQFALPKTKQLDPALIGGATLFGVGWALAGLCPGPALASLGTQTKPAAIFVLAMLTGMALEELTKAIRRSDNPTNSSSTHQ